MTPALHALVELGRALHASAYRFTTVTPETQRRVNARAANARARSLRDVFGWSRPFGEDGPLSRGMIDLLRAAGALVETPDGWKSAIRFSSLGERLFVHSAYPTHDEDAVFFGPDTVRFVALALRVVQHARRVVDVGCGSGAGGIALGARCERVVLADVNRKALDFARVNAALDGKADIELVESDVLAGVEGPIDLVIANPPYMRDAAGRTYRDGGGDRGEALSVRIVDEAMERLEPGGTLVLYTGVAIVDGEDPLLRHVAPILARAGATHEYAEIDPDVFGEELDTPACSDVERIAAVGLVATKP